jgi:hypothetical protein
MCAGRICDPTIDRGRLSTLAARRRHPWRARAEHRWRTRRAANVRRTPVVALPAIGKGPARSQAFRVRARHLLFA